MNLPARIEAHLRNQGPATARELAVELGEPFTAISGRLSSMKTQGRAHIGGYRRDDDGGRLYPRAMWAAGEGRDAKKPAPLNKSSYNDRHRNRQFMAVSSVFQLGTPVRQRRVAVDWRSVGRQPNEVSSPKL